MASQITPRPPFQVPMTDARGYVTPAWQPFISAIFDKTGGPFDKVAAAFTAASGAASASAQVVPGAGLHGGGPIGPNAALALYVAITSVAMLPASAGEGDLAYATDGRKPGESAGAGTGMIVWWSNGAWNAVDTGAAVTA